MNNTIKKKFFIFLIIVLLVYLFDIIRQNYNIYKMDKVINDIIVMEIPEEETEKNDINGFYNDEIFYLFKEKETFKEFSYLFNNSLFPKIVPIKFNIYNTDRVLKRVNEEVNFYAVKNNIKFSYKNFGNYEYKKSYSMDSRFLDDVAYYMIKDYLYTNYIGFDEFDRIGVDIKNEKISFYGSYIRNSNKWEVERENGTFKNIYVDFEKGYLADEKYTRHKEKGELKRTNFSNKKAKYSIAILKEIIYQNSSSTIPKKVYHYYDDKEVYLATFNEFGSNISFKKIK